MVDPQSADEHVLFRRRHGDGGDEVRCRSGLDPVGQRARRGEGRGLVVPGGDQRGTEQVRIELCGRVDPDLCRPTAGQCGELRRTSLGDLDAAVDDHDAVGEGLRLVHEVGREDDSHAVAAQGVDEFPHREPGLGVHSRGRFIQEDEFRSADEGAGQGETLLLPPGQPPVRRPGVPGESDEVEEPVGIEGAGAVGGGQLEHLPHPDARVGTPSLEHHTDPASYGIGFEGGIETEDPDVSGRGFGESLAHLDRRRLARAVGAEQREDGSGFDPEVQMIDGTDVAEGPRQSADLQRGGCGRRAHPSSHIICPSHDGQSRTRGCQRRTAHHSRVVTATVESAVDR